MTGALLGDRFTYIALALDEATGCMDMDWQTKYDTPVNTNRWCPISGQQ
jgi:hypothetical protein